MCGLACPFVIVTAVLRREYYSRYWSQNEDLWNKVECYSWPGAKARSSQLKPKEPLNLRPISKE